MTHTTVHQTKKASPDHWLDRLGLELGLGVRIRSNSYTAVPAILFVIASFHATNDHSMQVLDWMRPPAPETGRGGGSPGIKPPH